jgi:hypothetical protein
MPTMLLAKLVREVLAMVEIIFNHELQGSF